MTEGGEVKSPSVLAEFLGENIIEEMDLGDIVAPEYQYLIVNYLASIKNPEVINMVVARESLITIAGRAGAIPYVTAEDITIPSQVTVVELPLISADGKKVVLWEQRICHG